MPKSTEVEVCYMDDRLTLNTRREEIATHFGSHAVAPRRAYVYLESRRTHIVVRHLDGSPSNGGDCIAVVYGEAFSRVVFS